MVGEVEDAESSRAFWEFIDRRGKEVVDSYPVWLRQMLPAPKSSRTTKRQVRTHDALGSIHTGHFRVECHVKWPGTEERSRSTLDSAPGPSCLPCIRCGSYVRTATSFGVIKRPSGVIKKTIQGRNDDVQRRTRAFSTPEWPIRSL